MSGSFPTRAQAQAVLTIDLAALVANWRLLARLSQPAECAAVVKADAYGLGAAPVVRALAAAGCRTFFVAHVSEGTAARAALGPGPTIYVLNGVLPIDGVPAALREADLRPVLAAPEQGALWAQAGAGAPAAVQINTGVNRLGMAAADALAILRAGAVNVDLAMSHFVASEEADNPLNARQIAAFAAVAPLFCGARASLANSSGIFLPQKPFHDLTRPGYALYGGNPTPGAANPMQPVVRLEAAIIQVRDVAAGETAGYNATWTAARPSRLATIGVGYADGFLRSASGSHGRRGGEAIVGGVRCPIAGRVSMDLTILDVTDVPGAVTAGDSAVLLGEGIGVDDLAERAGTIGYEILTGLGPRYERVYERV